MNARRVRLRVRGRVQGVGFRFATEIQAERLGLSGWVRNASDGGVEILVQGEPEAVAALVRWAAQGPPGARVDGVDVTDDVPQRGLQGFAISR